MFKCTQCDRTFTRNGSLLRHMRRLIHTRSNILEFPSNNNDGVAKNQFENTVDNEHNDGYINSAENKISSAQHEAPESDYEDYDGKNDFSFGRSSAEGEYISPMFQNKHEDDANRYKRSLNPFDKSMIAATEAIKSKFNALKNSHNILQSKEEEKDNWSNGYEQKDLPASNYKETSFTPNMAGLLQTALDILMIKELQNTCVKDEGEEQEYKNSFNQTEMKRSPTSEVVDGEQNEDVKRPKYDNSMAIVSANQHNSNSKYVEEEDWYDPNPSVDELRNLVVNTQIGKEMSEIIRNLMGRNLQFNGKNIMAITTRFVDYIENEKQRNELHKLKKTDIGRRIVSIIRELEKYDIIEPMSSKILNDDDGEESDVEESIVGRGLYLRPYRKR